MLSEILNFSCFAKFQVFDSTLVVCSFTFPSTSCLSFPSLYSFIISAFFLDQRLDLRGHRVRSLNAGGLNLSPNLEVNIFHVVASVLMYAELCSEFFFCYWSLSTDTPVWQFVYLRDNFLSTLEGIELLKRVKVCCVIVHNYSISFFSLLTIFSWM